MAYQSPAFFFFHGLRDAGEGNIALAGGTPPGDAFPLHDSRQGELMIWGSTLGVSDTDITVTRADTPENDAVDHMIFSGTNLNGTEIGAEVVAVQDLVDPDHLVTEVNGTLIVIPFTATSPVSAGADIQIRISSPGAPTDSIKPEISELFLTTKRTLVRGPLASWEHSWRRTQISRINDAGVTSTILTGAARKTHRMTWRHLFGADRQILLDMRIQTNDWSSPFFFLPPDSDLLGVGIPQLVELDRDANWVQDFLNPLESGTSDRVTLPMIQALG